MYLSRVAIDEKKYESMKALYNLERLHGMVENSFPGERQRNLWRLDRLAGESYILLLSSLPPQSDTLPRQIGYCDSVWETKPYDTLLSKIAAGTKWYFRLTANPTMAVMEEGRNRGRVKAITVSHKQREWIKKQGLGKGFLLQDGQYDVVQNEWKTIKKGDREIHILAASFEGVLTVTDADTFRQTLILGIGREKAYGMGLLTVVPYD